ncbi:MAG: CerR family C-terminal domain-containing protein [Sphingomonas sp.]|uniref:CerR family C-terminal domain-containing protein n=1 Tax=Sphingomonas sp. TaxID=28214 RepID=UPI0025F7C1EE|nr:CerR family C-terminal domain-containing protein [Sphingomonas sp.]MBX9881174.1 CerR family C-terminal domain-containing protein [Sphingomonas sp.]
MASRETHERLLDIAVEEFGAKGLEGASTRSIAAAAGTAMSSITYHYGGKEGLYLAAADHIARRTAEEFGPNLALASEKLPEDAVAARALLQRMIADFADKMVSPEIEARSLFIVREQMRPTQAFDRIYGGLLGTMLGQLAELVCIATASHDRYRARLLTVTLIGQVIVMRASRASCLRLLERDQLDAALVADLKARIAANIDAILDSIRQEPA